MTSAIGPGGLPFYTMRLVQGDTLLVRLQRATPADRTRLIDALIQVAAALAYAHQQDVLHRDLKPANIAIGRFGEVAVLDWGLAKATRPAGSGADSVRTSRSIDLLSYQIGSPGYMAPEQSHGVFTVAGDVYSAGAILHHILVGHPPRSSGTKQYLAPRDLPSVDPRLITICNHAIAEAPEQRYASIGAFAQDLRRALERGAARRGFTSALVRSAQALGRWWRRLTAGFASSPTVEAAYASGGPALTRVARAPGDDNAHATGRGSPDKLRARILAMQQTSTPSERYRIDRMIAGGGMGRVYVATDVLLHRRVAIKSVHPVMNSDSVLERFVDEAQICAQLDHPSIVPVHEIGVGDTGEPRYVMPLFDGPTLADRLGQRSDVADWQNLTRILLSACRGLAFAHAKGVVHRDVKPSNILVGEHEDAYLIDWGLAMLTGEQDTPTSAISVQRGSEIDPGLTTSETRSREQAGQIVGTPSYMAPEQWAADHDSIGPRSDVYSLGATLYEVLSGRTVHPWNELGHLGFSEKLHMALQEPITPVLRHNPKAPPLLARVCETALRRNPIERYPDAAAFAHALQRAAEDSQ